MVAVWMVNNARCAPRPSADVDEWSRPGGGARAWASLGERRARQQATPRAVSAPKAVDAGMVGYPVCLFVVHGVWDATPSGSLPFVLHRVAVSNLKNIGTSEYAQQNLKKNVNCCIIYKINGLLTSFLLNDGVKNVHILTEHVL